MQDSWCKPIKKSNGQNVYGGAARNMRIAAMGGMDNLLAEFCMLATARVQSAPQDIQSKETLWCPLPSIEGGYKFQITH